MTTKLNRESDTKVSLEIAAELEVMKKVKKSVLESMRPEVSAPGFRKGKVPLNIVEKQVDRQHLEREFLDQTMTQLYQEALKEHKLRPVSAPQVNVTKFVAFTTLEFKIEVEVVPPIKLADYKKMKKKAPKVSVEKKDIDEVIKNIRTQLASKKEVKRAAKDGDEVIIDFVGHDDKGKKLEGGSGTDYPLAIGSKTFIPGFEEEVIGLKPGEDKTFDIKFPKNYGAAKLAGTKAKFTVTVKGVKEVKLPEVDDKLAAKAGPFKTVKELTDDIDKQLSEQKQKEAVVGVKNEILEEIAKKSKLELPKSLVDAQIEARKQELKQNLVYRGMTWDEFIAQSGKSEEKYTEEVMRPDSEMRVRIGLVLSDIAQEEKITVTPEDLEVRIQLMKGQYQEDAMKEQLDKPEVRRDILSQMLSEKTVDYLYELIVK